MLCQQCQKTTASVHFTQIINNKKTEMYLCEQCANEKGQLGLGSPLNISDFLSGFIGLGNNDQRVSSLEQRDNACEVCGMSFEDFRKTGKMGCKNCYNIYGERLKPILKSLHGNTEHVGKIPAKLSKDIMATNEINKLKEMLVIAVNNEEYEKAAEIRDKIKKIEAEQTGV